MNQRATSQPRRRALFPWLGGAALLLMLVASVLGWRALQQDRADDVRNESALRLSAQVIETQQHAACCCPEVGSNSQEPAIG